MKIENRLMCHVHAHAYFGGVTRVLLPDNLKAGVTSNTRYKTQLNQSYQDFKGSRMNSHKRLTKFSVQPIVKPEHMPDRHREYLNNNADDCLRSWKCCLLKNQVGQVHKNARTA